MEIVVLEHADQHFAVDMAQVAEIIEAAPAPPLLSGMALREKMQAAEHAAEPIAYLLFRCAGEIYGLRLADVAEVMISKPPTPVPQAPTEVAGMLLRHGTPLLTLALPTLLGRPDAGPASTLAVVEQAEIRVALGIDQVLGIERFPPNDIQPLPQSELGLAGFAVSLQHGMTSLIELSSLLSPERIATYRKLTACKVQENNALEPLQNTNDEETTRLLTFRAGNQRCALPLDWVRQVAEVGHETAAPAAAGGHANVVQIHGEVIPVIDLACVLGGSDPEIQLGLGAYLVVATQDGTWALKVDKVERVIILAYRQIESVQTAAGGWIGAVGKLDGQSLSIIRLDPLQPPTPGWLDLNGCNHHNPRRT